MAIRCVYTDLDGTLLGRRGALVHDADGGFTLLGVRGLEACARAQAEVVPMSGRRRATTGEIARLLGQSSYVYEVGCGVVVDGEDMLLTGNLQPRDGMTVYELIAATGAPRLLLDRYAGRLEYHSPWHEGREFTHLMRGLVDVAEADALLAEHGHGDLRLVDNGAVAPKPSLPGLDGPPHAYHLMPRTATKANAVAAHMQSRGYAARECVAVGDSREDLGVADVVGRFFLVANAVEKDPAVRSRLATNAEVTEGRNGEGFYEAVVRSLAETRGG
jgi:hydroxymethylpyrimidine pyrophosphatase-like HAD family hydrolase